MQERGERIITRPIEDELRDSYLTYMMSVITNRAIPDVRDGLKPSTRRILYAMHEMGLAHNRPYKKSAAIVGEVMGKYHPHGDAPIYSTLVGMAQDFSMRYPLIDGQGNFGCFTGDTKIKLLDGTEKSFEELSKLPPEEKFYVYSVDKNGRIVIGEGRHARITRRNAQLVEVTLDNGEKIRCTPDHRFMLRDGTYKEAQRLVPGDSLMAAYFDTAPVRKGTNEYLRVRQPDGKWEFVHHLADKFNESKGLAREIKGGFVCHHANFNRFDNRPANIVRLTVKEHVKIHAEQIAKLWDDENFRRKQLLGVKRYYKENPEVLEERRKRFIEQNTDENFRRANGRRISVKLREFYAKNPHKCREISERMKSLWRDPNYQERMKGVLRGLKKRELTPKEKERVSRIISEKSRKMWKDEDKRQEIISAIRRSMNNESVRAKLSENSKKLWGDPEYRSKFPENHFSLMAKKLWEDPAIRELHRQKLKKQREDPLFVEKQREGVRRSNKLRLAENPDMMKEMTARAADSLKKLWNNPEYKIRVMRSKVAGYVSSILHEVGRENFTPELYEEKRNSNWIPHFEKALSYFDGKLEDLLDYAETYNHKVVSVRWLDERADVYDITVDEHHNFLLASGVFVHNSIDGDPPAAMRYSEARMTLIAEEMLADIDKDTVEFQPNYDDSLMEPKVLPSKFPNLLVNGSLGIAVVYTTKIPPHNLNEAVDAAIMLLENPNSTIDDLMKAIEGPDFPTGGIIVGRRGIKEAYKTGKGHITVRAKATIERGKGNDRIVITEIPYQVNKTTLKEKIADLVNSKTITGISDIRDESDRTGIRVVIELKRGEIAQVVLNQLYKHSHMQITYGVIMVALVNGQPRLLNLKDLIWYYLEHRREVVRRRTEFDLRRCQHRAHILEGYRIALNNIEEVIQIVEEADSPSSAREELVERFSLSEEQASEILSMTLQRLTGLERQRINDEYAELLLRIEELKAILQSPILVDNIIKDELLELKAKYGDERRTEIIDEIGEFRIEDLIADEDMVITITHEGYIKRIPVSTYRRQRRGGVGVKGMDTKEGDFVEHIFIATNHQYILFFTDRGRCYWLRVFEIPKTGRSSKGRAIVNLLRLDPDERIAAFVPVREFRDDRFVFMVTRKGTVKKTNLSEFSRPISSGIIAINLPEDDELIDARLTDGSQDVVLITRYGMSIRFDEEEVRSMGRAAYGVRGIRLREGDSVIGMAIAKGGSTLLVVTENGYGKRTDISEYKAQSRGGVGIITMKTGSKTGDVIGAKSVSDSDEIILTSSNGMVTRISVRDIRVIGRNTQGVRLMSLQEGEKVVDVAMFSPEGEDEEDKIRLRQIEEEIDEGEEE
jgi:DNA gyrase subunit A